MCFFAFCFNYLCHLDIGPICVFVVLETHWTTFHTILVSIYVSFYGISNIEAIFGFVFRLWIVFVEVTNPFWLQLMVLQGAWILMMCELLSIISCHTQLM
jgi:hypothetical protein